MRGHSAELIAGRRADWPPLGNLDETRITLRTVLITLESNESETKAEKKEFWIQKVQILFCSKNKINAEAALCMY